MYGYGLCKGGTQHRENSLIRYSTSILGTLLETNIAPENGLIGRRSRTVSFRENAWILWCGVALILILECRGCEITPRISFLVDYSGFSIQTQLDEYLGGGFKHVLFSSLPGEMIQFDEHIFPMGWFNHQPEYDCNLGSGHRNIMRKCRKVVPEMPKLWIRIFPNDDPESAVCAIWTLTGSICRYKIWFDIWYGYEMILYNMIWYDW